MAADTRGLTTDGAAAPTHGANIRNVWKFPTQGRPDAHFATFPDELPRRCILASTSEHGVCAECGNQWERQAETAYSNPGNRTTDGPLCRWPNDTRPQGLVRLTRENRHNHRLASHLRMRRV